MEKRVKLTKFQFELLLTLQNDLEIAEKRVRDIRDKQTMALQLVLNSNEMPLKNAALLDPSTKELVIVEPDKPK